MDIILYLGLAEGVIGLVKIGNVYNMGTYFVPFMVEKSRKIVSSYGSGFGVVGFKGTDMKEFLLWVLQNSMMGVYDPVGLYVKEPYIGYYLEGDNVWLNMWRLSFHATPLGLEGEMPISPYPKPCPFYKLALLIQMEEITRMGNITDINMLSIVEKKIYEQKVKIVLGLDRKQMSKIESLVCALYGDNMLSSLPMSIKRRFSALGREICNV